MCIGLTYESLNQFIFGNPIFHVGRLAKIFIFFGLHFSFRNFLVRQSGKTNLASSLHLSVRIIPVVNVLEVLPKLWEQSIRLH